jgi:hypothetical protein
MNRHLMGGLLALYPRAFRDRYGTDLASLTDDLIRAGEFTPLLAALDLLGGAALEWGRVLACSRHAAQAMTVAAIMAVAGSMYVMTHVRPQNTPASVRGVSAPAVIGPNARCMVLGVPAPVMEVVPGKLSAGPQPLPVAAGVASHPPQDQAALQACRSLSPQPAPVSWPDGPADG